MTKLGTLDRGLMSLLFVPVTRAGIGGAGPAVASCPDSVDPPRVHGRFRTRMTPSGPSTSYCWSPRSQPSRPPDAGWSPWSGRWSSSPDGNRDFGEVIVSDLPYSSVQPVRGRAGSTGLEAAAAAASGLPIAEAWNLPAVIELLESADLLWHGPAEWANLGTG